MKHNRIQQDLIPSRSKKKTAPFRLSLRYKVPLPVLIFVTFMIFLIFRTTFKTVSSLVLERNERRLQAIAEVFAETIKVPLILNNQQVLLANVEWMAKRPDVLEVRVEDASGVIVGGEQPTYVTLPPTMIESRFLGVRRVNPDTYAVAVPIRAHDRNLGRVLILFTKQGLEAELRNVFENRLLLALILALLLAFITAGVTWFAIRPLFILKKTAQEILAGDLTARAHIHSFDEIQDLSEAFNEMVARLAKSLDNLRARTEALEESEEKYRVFVENASDILFTMTPEGSVELLNKGMSGYPREEIYRQGFSGILALHSEDSRKKIQEAFDEVKTTKKPIMNLPVTHIHRVNNAEIFYLVNLTPVLDHNGNIKLIQGVMRDVTELKRIDIMKDSLIRDVAHELKTPTAKFEMAVTWFEKQITKSGDRPTYQQIIDIMKRNIDRLSRTITSIMDLSKLESGVDQLVAEPLDLNEVLDQVCQDMEPICQQKHLKLEMHLSKEPLKMKGDRDMLYRLFVNLIGNSTKFTSEGKITLKSEKIEEEKIRVSVTDTGPGIEKEYLAQIFERFVQRTAASSGIGVGLTISRDIAALHQGRIWAESEGLGKGATFRVEFPAL